MGELMLADAGVAHNLSVAILRYFNVAGADPRMRTGQSTPIASLKAKNWPPLNVACLQTGMDMLSILIALEADVGQVLVRNLDDRVIESLKTKAELKGHSLEQELRDVLVNAAPLTPAEKIALFHKLRATTPPLGDIDVRAAIRHGRDDEFNE